MRYWPALAATAAVLAAPVTAAGQLPDGAQPEGPEVPVSEPAAPSAEAEQLAEQLLEALPGGSLPGPAAVTVPLQLPEQRVEGAPRLLAAGLTAPPAVGGRTALRLVTRDRTAAVSGAIVDFGEAGGRRAASACRSGERSGPFRPGARVSFDFPYTFTTAGTHSIAITIISGGCGTARTTTQSVSIEVADAATAAHSATARLARAAGMPCRNWLALPGVQATPVVTHSLHCLINFVRTATGRSRLTWSPRLAKAAMGHSRAMVSRGMFGHELPGLPSLAARARRAGYRYKVAENLGAGTGLYGSPVGILIDWLNSPPHRLNLLRRTNETVGVALVPRFPLPPHTPPAGTYTVLFAPKR